MRNLFLSAAAIALAASGAYAQPEGRGKDRGAKVSAKAEVRANARANARRDNRAEARQERRAEARVAARQDRRPAARVEARQDRRASARVEARQERRVAARANARQDAREDDRQIRRAAERQREEARARARTNERRAAERQRVEARAEARARTRANERRAEVRADARAEARARARTADRREELRDRARRAERRADTRRDELRDRARRAERRADNRRENVRERRQDWREDRRERLQDRRENIRDARRLANWRNDRRIIRERNRDYWRFAQMDRRRGLINGCPPGLAKKWNGCMPPGQVRARYRDYNYRTRYGYEYRPRLFGLTSYDRGYNGRYYYDDGYLFRMGNSGGIASYIPLLGGALAIGNPWPASYDSYNVPDYYVDYYNLGPRSNYRYADNVLYRYDDDDALITAIAALLTGNQINIGQRMPMGYDVYNVPYAYRDQYYDTPDANYRYSDGYVYRIDPETQLVAAAVNLLTDGDVALNQPGYNQFAVGQPMPMGYDVYNVPYGYRDRYYDTPDAHYRYSDGYVYQVDPETQLIAAAINLLV